MRRTRLILLVLLATLSIGYASENEKRAPSGFQGVRGKKSIQDTYHENLVETEDAMDKRIPSSGFMGMRGKKLFPERNDYFSDYPKRAPQMGFLGMRGKKEYEISDDFEKRAPQMGFLGMRGKKDSELYEDDYNYLNEKRAPSGFMGMRGKKEFSQLSPLSPFSLESAEDKRAPSAGFFGMRGKKQPGRSSFFGMRGKKYPYELRGKFVGVRGKKGEENEIPDSEYLSNEDLSFLNDLDLNQLMYLLAQGERDEYNLEKRKGPSGFLGMRG